MPRRRKRSPNNTASTPERVLVKKKQRQDDEASILETILSRNQYSTGGTAANDSDLGDIDADEPQQDQPTPGRKHSAPPDPMKVKLPPLVVKHIPQEKLARKITSLGVDAEYKLTRIGTKILTHTKADYNLVASLLKDSKAEFFTHDIPGEKPFKAVIRGLPNLDPQKIAGEIKDRYKLVPTAVYRMVRRDEAVKKYPNNLFLVHFAKGTVTLNSLQAIRSLFQIIVRWEAYRGGHRDVTQCQRCLQFGHGTRNCFVNPRCSNCAELHATSDCPAAGAAVEGTVAFKCANCGGAHQATDKQCGKREEFKRIRKAAFTTNQPRRKAVPTLRPEDFPPLSQNRHANRRVAPAPPPASNPWLHRQAPPVAAAQQNKSSGAAVDDSLLSDEELVMIVTEVLEIKRSCKTRAEQLQAVVSLISKYGD